MNKNLRNLEQDLCSQIRESLQAGAAGNASVRRWLASTFPGHTIQLDEAWRTPVQPESLESRISDRQLEAQELMERLGNVQAEINELGRMLHAEKHAHLRQEIVARQAEWQANQIRGQQQAAGERFAEVERTRQANVNAEAQRQANIAREHRERAERDAANMAAKRRQLQEAGYWPNN